MSTNMSKAQATELVALVRDYTTTTEAAVAPDPHAKRGYVVTALGGDGEMVYFRWESDVRSYPTYDPTLPAKRRAESELRYRQMDFKKDGQRIVSSANDLVELLRRVALRIETDATITVARRDHTLPAVEDRDAARRHEDNYDSLARRVMDELDFVRTAAINRNFGDCRLDLARSALQLRALLPQSANEDGDDTL